MTLPAADPFREWAVREWAARLSLEQLLAVMEAIQDSLIERRAPAAALVNQACAMVRRQVKGA